MLNKIVNYSFVVSFFLILFSCGSTHPIVSSGQVHEAGFFLGLFGGLLWPLSLIMIGVGYVFPSISGDAAMYYYFNTGFGYWLGYIIGFIPYAVLLYAILTRKSNQN